MSEPKIGEVFTWRPSRRQFLKAAGGVAAAAAVAGPMTSAFGRVQAGAPQAAGSVGATEVFTLCEMCVWRCGVTAKVKDGRIVKLDGNPYHPHSRGVLCPRGQAGLGLTYDPGSHQVSHDAGGRAGERPVEAGHLGAGAGLRGAADAGYQAEVRPAGHDLQHHAQPHPEPVREPAERLWLAQLRHAAQPVLQLHDRLLPVHLWDGGAGARLPGRALHSVHRAQSAGGDLQLRDAGPDAGDLQRRYRGGL